MKRKHVQGSDISHHTDTETPWLARIACAAIGKNEQRGCQRKPVDFMVSLNEYLTWLGNGWIRDMSLHGAFIELIDERLSAGMSVQIGFPVLFAGLPIERRLSAQVVRVESDGVALRFEKYNPDFYSDLISLLDAA